MTFLNTKTAIFGAGIILAFFFLFYLILIALSKRSQEESKRSQEKRNRNAKEKLGTEFEKALSYANGLNTFVAKEKIRVVKEKTPPETPPRDMAYEKKMAGIRRRKGNYKS